MGGIVLKVPQVGVPAFDAWRARTKLAPEIAVAVAREWAGFL
jgi:hypothetical protein